MKRRVLVVGLVAVVGMVGAELAEGVEGSLARVGIVHQATPARMSPSSRASIKRTQSSQNLMRRSQPAIRDQGLGSSHHAQTKS